MGIKWIVIVEDAARGEKFIREYDRKPDAMAHAADLIRDITDEVPDMDDPDDDYAELQLALESGLSEDIVNAFKHVSGDYEDSIQVIQTSEGNRPNPTRGIGKLSPKDIAVQYAETMGRPIKEVEFLAYGTVGDVAFRMVPKRGRAFGLVVNENLRKVVDEFEFSPDGSWRK